MRLQPVARSCFSCKGKLLEAAMVLEVGVRFLREMGELKGLKRF